MLGNLITNSIVEDLRKSLQIQIRHFVSAKMHKYFYELSWTDQMLNEKYGKSQIHPLTQGHPFAFDPGEYGVAVIKEEIILGPGIVGLFVPASSLIELGFGVTVGKLDPGYGSKGERIRFGVKNLKNTKNNFYWDTPLAHLLFFDLRGLRSDPVPTDPYDLVKIDVRKLEDIVESAKRLQAELDKAVPFGEFGKQS